MLAVDVEAAALDATRANAALNGVEVRTIGADARRDPLPGTDTAVANIALAAVEEIAPRLGCARLVTSGYIVVGRPSLEGWEHVERRELQGWAADLWVRRVPGP